MADEQPRLPADFRGWRDFFDERQCKEIAFCILYLEQFHHGTDGHNLRMLVGLMAKLLDTEQEHAIRRMQDEAFDRMTQQPMPVANAG